MPKYNNMGEFKNFLKEDTDFYNEKHHYDAQIAYLYAQDMPMAEIQNAIESIYGSTSYGEIYRSLKRSGINPNRKTRPYQADVVYYKKSGLPLDEIAKLTGYTVRHIRNILAWNNLRD